MEPSFEFFDHTADMGVRVRAASLAALFRTAGEALYAAIGQLAVRDESKSISFELKAGDTAELLQDYLSKLLVAFESDHAVIRDVVFETLTEQRLVATGQSRPLDAERSVFHREVKAITYHQLSVTKTAGGFEAVFILDI
jgi:SHS2 domain-containing protein